mgnify:CR=1 FL=1
MPTISPDEIKYLKAYFEPLVLPEEALIYAVYIGRKPGIYFKWDGLGGAREQTDGYSNAKHKKCKSFPEVFLFFETGTY